MNEFLQLFLWLPFIGFITIMAVPAKKEKLIADLSISISFLLALLMLAFLTIWLMVGMPLIDYKGIVLFETDEISIFIDLYFDKISAVFSFIGAIMSFIVFRFSKFYLHRDPGFKRYYALMLLFLMSYNFVVLSGNFETLFLGWEIVGICSFLLIGFFRDRYLPVRNSLKVISLYRLGDIFLILAMWMSHHLWHQNITFLQLTDTNSVLEHISEHNWYAFFIALMIVLASMVKSATFPFSSWLPRAMEGPTSSSALFYGALSVHLGVFLLLRTLNYWESLLLIKVLIFGIGILTSFVATSIASVQSSVKVQIAYASIAQIGLMFVEISLGFYELALVHFVGNACLRTYQLLVSPSVLGYKIHSMFFTFEPTKTSSGSSFFFTLKNSLFMLSLQEFRLDNLLQKYLWNPVKRVGNSLHFLSNPVALSMLFLLFVFGFSSNYFISILPEYVHDTLPHLFSLLALMLIVRAFTEKQDPFFAWLFCVASQLFLTLSISLLNENFGQNHVLLYFSGAGIFALIGFLTLARLKKLEPELSMLDFQGHSYEHPKLALLFLISCLGFLGLPFTPTFIGIDILFSHIHKHEELLIVFTALSFLIMEISILRIYARLFLGTHTKNYHPIAYRSS
ncbi:MAG TPA: proton-conducting transporter membrane subunit [Bacteroidia bacterium]|nr:proton-conducting transporter membrane subunit [Bacteroidia bacterium]